MQRQCSSQRDELPNCTDTPLVRLAASSTACNGVVASPVCPSVDVVAIPSQTISERGITCFCRKVFATRASIFSPRVPSGLVYSYHASKRKPEPWMCKSDSFVFVTLEQHRCGLRSTVNLLFLESRSRSVICVVSPAWICTWEKKG